LWAQAVEDASKVRRRRWPIVKRVLGATATAVILLSVLGGGCYAVVNYLNNVQRLRQSEKIVLDYLNPWLGSANIEPLKSLHFTDAPPFLRLPASVSFENELVTLARTSRRSAGFLKGTFDRPTGTLTLDLELASGTRQQGITVHLSPVP